MFFGVSHSSASRTVAVLVRKGLVAVSPERGADNSRHLALTPPGWEVLKHDPLRRVADVIADLPQPQSVALHDALAALVARMKPGQDAH